MKFLAKNISSLEKCLPTDNFSSKRELSGFSALRKETLSYQIAYTIENWEGMHNSVFYAKAEAPDGFSVKMSRIENVPVKFNTYPECGDDNYISKAPGLFPDLMLPIIDCTELRVAPGCLHSIWVDVEIPSSADAGENIIKVSFFKDPHDSGSLVETLEFSINVIGVDLPEQELTVTQWFHCDCLAEYYGVDVFSEKHWEIIGNYMKSAAKNGINTILTPVFTPPLDTALGKERPTVQLTEVFYESGNWSFDFARLDRWIELALSSGIRYFEISHLFTQWGAKHAPKVVGWKNGRFVKLFGWETDASSDEYAAFLRSFLRALTVHLKKRGVDDRCFFHISDEPTTDHIDSYATAKAMIADLLAGYQMIDALSSVEFYRLGLIEHPIPSVDHVETFLEADVKDLWVYYCCAQHTDVSNRFIAMPLSRERIIGAQMYKYSIAGFLHWGFNFWFTMGSQQKIDPYVCNDAGGVPAGDPFSVYPAPDGSAYESIRLVCFRDAITDLRAMKLCEELCGREAVLAAIDEIMPAPFDFKNFPQNGMYILALRAKINSMIEEAL